MTSTPSQFHADPAVEELQRRLRDLTRPDGGYLPEVRRRLRQLRSDIDREEELVAEFVRRVESVRAAIITLADDSAIDGHDGGTSETPCAAPMPPRHDDGVPTQCALPADHCSPHSNR